VEYSPLKRVHLVHKLTEINNVVGPRDEEKQTIHKALIDLGVLPGK